MSGRFQSRQELPLLVLDHSFVLGASTDGDTVGRSTGVSGEWVGAALTGLSSDSSDQAHQGNPLADTECNGCREFLRIDIGSEQSVPNRKRHPEIRVGMR